MTIRMLEIDGDIQKTLISISSKMDTLKEVKLYKKKIYVLLNIWNPRKMLKFLTHFLEKTLYILL